ncbi:MAG TPA: RNA 2',3'-cyclic phosphodiesterase, partial [Anaerolineales bacterium]|nr:RNA 2',3'-cyclic phosphodiesterase [Anaerolineales bacterium]
GAFPSVRRARVIWTGVQAPPDLIQLQRAIEAETARLGYAAEERGFTPHLTLGRVSRNANANDARRISQALDELQVGFLGAMRVEAVHLFRSDLKPGGAVYTRLFTAPLGLPAKKI